MKMLVGNEDLSKRIRSTVGNGKLILYKYGPGSGGDKLLLDMFQSTPKGYHPMLITTHSTKEELMDSWREQEMEKPPEMISMMGFLDDVITRVERKDRFIEEGILVTDLLEISSNSDEPVRPKTPAQLMMSKLTTISTGQVLPFWLIIDSIKDIIDIAGMDDAMLRLMILKRSLREKKGIAVIACPLDYPELEDLETTFFDAVIEVWAEKRGEAWTRKFIMKNIKGSVELPDEREITIVKDIPSAISME